MDLLSRSTPAPLQVPIDPRIAQTSVAALIAVKSDLQGPRGLAMSDGLRLLLAGPAAEPAPLPNAEQLQALAAALPANRAAVVFLFENDSLLTWVVARGTIAFSDRAIARTDVERRAAALSVQIARAVNPAIWKETLTGLHDLLLRDLPGVTDVHDLLIVADGPLTRVPFGSLVERRSGQFLFERMSVRMAPSLLFGLREAPAPGGDTTVLSIGAPELTDAARLGLAPLPRARRGHSGGRDLSPIACVDRRVGDEGTRARPPRRRGRHPLRRPCREQQRRCAAPAPRRRDCRPVQRPLGGRSDRPPPRQPRRPGGM
jgi:hypothetical protein